LRRAEPSRRSTLVGVVGMIARGKRQPLRESAANTIARSPPADGTVSNPIGSIPSGGAPVEPHAFESELAGVIVQALNLEIAAAQIEPEAPLFGDGLGLDSIDILELALEVSQRYGFQLRADDEDNQKIFRSLRTLAAHVAQHRTR
jgi:acyl carrier protein